MYICDIDDAYTLNKIIDDSNFITWKCKISFRIILSAGFQFSSSSPSKKKINC